MKNREIPARVSRNMVLKPVGQPPCGNGKGEIERRVCGTVVGRQDPGQGSGARGGNKTLGV